MPFPALGLPFCFLEVENSSPRLLQAECTKRHDAWDRHFFAVENSPLERSSHRTQAQSIFSKASVNLSVFLAKAAARLPRHCQR